jgi:hypothetical protein
MSAPRIEDYASFTQDTCLALYSYEFSAFIVSKIIASAASEWQQHLLTHFQ